MSLHALAANIRAERLAAAASATPATVSPLSSSSVAEVAGVAVAEPQTQKIAFASPKPLGAARAAHPDGERLRQATLAFQSGPFAGQAKALGWGEISLFGVHRDAPRRIDAWGLIPLLAWGCLGLTLTKVEADAATLASPRGSLIKHMRSRAGHANAVAWQTLPAFGEGGAL